MEKSTSRHGSAEEGTCIFCDIINLNVPAAIIYEDPICIVFLTHRPINPGHALVVTKEHMTDFLKTDDHISGHLISVGKKIGTRMQAIYSYKKVGFVLSGFEVNHLHWHIIGLNEPFDITSSKFAKIDNNQIIFKSDFIDTVSTEELSKIQKSYLLIDSNHK